MAIKPYSVSCVAAGQMDFSTVHEFIDDEIANNCFSSSRCRNILPHHQLRHNVPRSPPTNENRCRLFPNEAGRAHTDETSASVWCSPPPVAVATAIRPASSWPPSHLGAPPSLSQGAFQWGGWRYGGWLSLSSVSFAWGCCQKEFLLEWMEVNVVKEMSDCGLTSRVQQSPPPSTEPKTEWFKPLD